MNEYTTIDGKRINRLPNYVQDDEMSFSPNSLTVLQKRYVRRDENGEALETVAGMFYRVARVVAMARKEDSPLLVDEHTETFYRLMTDRDFFPNSPTFTGAGTRLGQLAACFVLPLTDDMGKEDGGIFDTLKNAALIQQTGGGNGFSFSRLRPKGDIVTSSGGEATGPVGFLQVYDQAFGVIAQGGSRRGASMSVLRCDHPDVEEFITCKAEEGKIANFNISVALTDEFMQAVESRGSFDLRNPRDGKVWRTVQARDLFDKIVKYAHRNGEPGALFIDAANRGNPVPHLYELEATNPCGEQWLGPYENCCLGSINLSNFVKDGKVNWSRLALVTSQATRFLDCVIDANAYVPAVPELREAALKARRIGLGIMGLADAMYKMGIRYGSSKGEQFAAQIMEFVRYWAMTESIRLARDYGDFPAIKGSIYDFSQTYHFQPPTSVVPYTHDFLRPNLDWVTLMDLIAQHGIRNAAQTTIAPTGTIATVVGCEGYGCEPVFALGYIRHFKDGDKDVELAYTSPLFDEALRQSELPENEQEQIRAYVSEVGSCQDLKLPESIHNTFVVSGDITAEEHVRMQAALQAFVDNSLSKTINFPQGATVEDVAEAYQLAWRLGCKGLTVYVTGSREQVVLETKATQQKKSETPDPTPATKAPRPHVINGATYRKETPIGTAYVTVNGNEGDPCEVFLNVGKAGSEVSAVSEAMGRLMSLVLRLPSPASRAERLAWIADELEGIGGGRPLGFGAKRVRSLPDGLAQVLWEHLGAFEPEEEPVREGRKTNGDICPECGEASFLNVEGCRKCRDCGYSEC